MAKLTKGQIDKGPNLKITKKTKYHVTVTKTITNKKFYNNYLKNFKKYKFLKKVNLKIISMN